MPFNHLSAIDTLINQMMGPSSRFPSSKLPVPSILREHVDIHRNSLTNLGVFLHEYQFQLTRLIPFISRLADLFQRESLIAEPRDRLEAQEIARSVGKALHEIVQATSPIAGLVEQVKLGDRPGNFRLVASVRPEAAPSAGTSPAPANSESQNMLSREMQEGLESALAALKERLEKEDKVLKEEAKTETLAKFVSKRVEQVVAQKAWDTSIRDLLPQAFPATKTQEKILLELLSDMKIHEGYELLKGNYEVISSVVPAILRIVISSMNCESSEEEIIKFIAGTVERLKEFVVIPPELKEKALSGFEPVARIKGILTKHICTMLNNLFLFEKTRNRKNLAEVLYTLLVVMIGESMAELSEGFRGGHVDALAFIKENVKVLLKTFDASGLGVLLNSLISEPLLKYIKASYKVYLLSDKKNPNTYTEDQKAVLSEMPKNSEETKNVISAAETKKEEVKDHNKESSQPINRANDNLFKRELKEAMRKLNINKEDIADTIGDIGSEVEDAYINYLRLEFKERVKGNAEYDPKKHKHLDYLFNH